MWLRANILVSCATDSSTRVIFPPGSGAETLKVLKQAAGQEGPASAVSKTLARLDQRRFAPPPGTVLVREWDRKSHRVMVMPDGFAWNGETFDSLSEIAFTITGTKWNGPRFFGLRDRRPHINGGKRE